MDLVINSILRSHFSSQKETSLLHSAATDLFSHLIIHNIVLLEMMILSGDRGNVPSFKATLLANLLATF
jgi:hypothetical protein